MLLTNGTLTDLSGQVDQEVEFVSGHAGEDHAKYDPVQDVVLIYLGILNDIIKSCKATLQSISIPRKVNEGHTCKCPPVLLTKSILLQMLLSLFQSLTRSSLLLIKSILL